MKIINFYGGAGIYKTTIVQKQIEIKLMPPVENLQVAFCCLFMVL